LEIFKYTDHTRKCTKIYLTKSPLRAPVPEY
jgi:hypothetical protein